MSKTPIGPLDVGDVTVYVLNIGDLKHSLVDSLNLPESAWKGRYDQFFVEWIRVPVQCALIQTAEATILVDAASSDLEENSRLSIPGYIAPPSLITQLATIGVGPGDVSHVVISHTHFDHYNGLTATDGRGPVPLYPNARVLVGRDDWEPIVQSAEFETGESLAAQMFAPYVAAERLEPVEKVTAITPEVTVEPSPSETPGHLSVCVRSRGMALHCIGDLYHHWTEVENRDWMVSWADPARTLTERRKFEELALADDAMIVASHIRGVGRLARAGDGVRWQELDV